MHSDLTDTPVVVLQLDGRWQRFSDAARIVVAWTAAEVARRCGRLRPPLTARGCSPPAIWPMRPPPPSG